MRTFPARTSGLWCSSLALALLPSAVAQTKPPVAPVRPVTDTYWNQPIVDPYRWLEDQTSPESKAWMKGQADFARATLDSLPGRKAFAADMTRYLNAAEATITDVQVAGDVLFYRKRGREDTIANLYVRKLSGGPEKLLINIAAMATPEHHISLDGYTPSEDGTLVMAGLSAGGSEDQTAHFYNASTGAELPDQLPRYEGGAFSPDGRTVFYIQLEKLGPTQSPIDKYRRPREYSHVLGTSTTEDKVIAGQGLVPDIPVPDYSFPIAVPVPTSKHVLGLVIPGVETFRQVYVGEPAALTTHTGWRKVADVADKITDAALEGDVLYLVSFEGTSNGKLLRTSALHPDLKHAEVLVPPGDLVFSGGFIGSDVLHQASDALYLRVLQHGYGQVLRLPYTPHPTATLVPLPAGMQVGGVSTDPLISGAVLDLDSWTSPGDFFRFSPGAAMPVATGLRPVNATDPKDLVAEEVEVKGWDGTMVPLSILYKKGLVKDGSAPTALIGYGAYGDAFSPGFSRRNMAWLERGGILAVAHVRGGGELGEAWHLAGKKLTKPNTWRDFISIAEYLVSERYTSTAHLGIWSQSAGGILIGRSITARPDLFAAAVDGVPCSDMLREETGANGPANIPEFGSVKTQAGFEDLYAMSAYYHIQPGTQYPAILMTAGANDPRVDPWQGGKMAARLQAATGSGKPVLLRVNYDAGHGITDTVAQQVSDWTDIYTFFLWNFGDPQFQPPNSH